MPTAIAAQNCLRSSCPATDGRPGENNGARPDRSERRRYLFIATSFIKVLRQPLESALAALSYRYRSWDGDALRCSRTCGARPRRETGATRVRKALSAGAQE